MSNLNAGRPGPQYLTGNTPNEVMGRRLGIAVAAAIDNYTVQRDVKYLVRNGIDPDSAVKRVIAHRRRMKVWGMLVWFWIPFWWILAFGGIYFTGHAVILGVGEVLGAEWPPVVYSDLISWKDHYQSGGVPGLNLLGMHEGGLLSVLVTAVVGLIALGLAIVFFRKVLMYPVNSWRQAAKGCKYEDSGKLPIAFIRAKHTKRGTPEAGVHMPGFHRSVALLASLPFTAAALLIVSMPVLAAVVMVLREIPALITALGA